MPSVTDAACTHAVKMTSDLSRCSQETEPTTSPSQKHAASDFTENTSPSSTQHGSALTRNGETDSARTETTSEGASRFSQDSPTSTTTQQQENGTRHQEASPLSGCQNPNSGSSMSRPSESSTSTSSQWEAKGRKPLTKSSKATELPQTTLKEACRLFSSALLLPSSFTVAHVLELLKLSEKVFDANKNVSTTIANQLRLTRNLFKVVERKMK